MSIHAWVSQLGGGSSSFVGIWVKITESEYLHMGPSVRVAVCISKIELLSICEYLYWERSVYEYPCER